MSVERLKLSNGLRVSVFVGLIAIFGQLAIVVWGAATLTARVSTIEIDHVEMKGVTTAVQSSINRQAVDLARMGVQLDNIERLLNQ